MTLIESIKKRVLNDEDLEKDLFNYEYGPKCFLFECKPYNKISKKELKDYETFTKQDLKNIFFFLRCYKYAVEEQKDEDWNYYFKIGCDCNIKWDVYDKIKKNVEYNINKVNEIRKKLGYIEKCIIY